MQDSTIISPLPLPLHSLLLLTTILRVSITFVLWKKIIKHKKDEEVVSTLQGSVLGFLQIKLSHALFELKPQAVPTSSESNNKNDSESETQTANRDDDTIGSDTSSVLCLFFCLVIINHKMLILDDDLGPEFAMETWPVDPKCSALLHDLLPSHNICPLPAYDLNNNLIPPTQYRNFLWGATVEVYFNFVHHFFKKNKCHIYNAMVPKIQILEAPAALPSSPFKCLHVSPIDPKGKKKARA
ncbi:hypothetical protein JVU11DRAFT_10735 [Chiua virens]|nr:hypothetical protein JVU11DRAFT_10735 [Chiua virens]